MRLDLTLGYELAEGWMAPYLEGLREGRAVAALCGRCGAASFPPRRVCACGGGAHGWKELSGIARIVGRSGGRDGEAALLRFEGASTACVARAEGLEPGATWARLLPARGARPALSVTALAEGAG